MHGLYLLWWVQERHVSAAAVAAVLAAGDLAVTIIEIPTGWFADRFGSRVSLIVGSAVQVAGMLCCWFGTDVPSLLGATLLVALGDGFRSGADLALLFRSCALLGRQDEFQRIEATTHTVELVGMVALVLSGGAIVELWGFHVGWFAETALSAAGLVIACAMVEPPASSDREPRPAADEATTVPVRLDQLSALLALTAPAAALSGVTTAVGFLAQTDGGEPGRLTWLVASITLLEAMGAAVAASIRPLGASGQTLLVAGGIVASGIVAAHFALWPALGLLSFLLGLMHPLRAAAIQRLASDDMRARAASVASACDKVCDTAALAVTGIWRRARRGR